MVTKGKGQYDKEYATCSCFWGVDPGKYVLLLLEHLNNGRVLDLGAGEGKNSIYLAERGFSVVAVECSQYAIENFERRLATLDPNIKSRIEIMPTDVLSFSPIGDFDAVISYGLLHCLPDLNALNKVVTLMKGATKINGFNVAVAFTDALPVPDVQDYLEPTLMPEGHLLKLYKDWEIVAYENDVIEETHPTSNIPHKHSLCRMLAKRK